VVDYAAMLAGSLPLYWTPVGLDEIVAHACAIMLPRFQELGVALENAVGPDAPVVSGDARRLTQVLTELLDNARKLTPAGGRVGVRACLEGGMARLEVWDTGPGIPEAQQQAIWEPFTQLETGDRQRKGGLGLGLAIVRKLTELHGGRVGLDSAPGRGSTFSISQPVAAP
jgi:signal transduction histidine kinase